MTNHSVSRFIPSDWGSFHCVDQWNDSKLLIILFHPYSKDAFFAQKVFSFLKNDAHLIAIDLPYHGQTKLQPKDITAKDFAQIITEIQAWYPEKTLVFAGHSFGARIACIATSGMQKGPAATVFYGPELGTTVYTKIFINKVAFALLSPIGKILLKGNTLLKLAAFLHRTRIIKPIAFQFLQLHQSHIEKAQLFHLWKLLAVSNKYLHEVRSNPSILGKARVWFGKNDQTTPIKKYKQSRWTMNVELVEGSHFTISPSAQESIKSFLAPLIDDEATTQSNG